MMAVSAGRSFLRKNDFFWIGGSRSACRFFRIDLLTFFDARNFYGSGSLTRVLPEGRFLTGSHNGSLGVRGRPSKSGAQSARFPGGSASLAAYRQPKDLFNAPPSFARRLFWIGLFSFAIAHLKPTGNREFCLTRRYRSLKACREPKDLLTLRRRSLVAEKHAEGVQDYSLWACP